MSDVKYAYYHSSKGYKIVGGNSNQLLRADGGVEDKTDYSVKSANETFGGVKTFTLSPIIPNATSPNHAVNKEQLDAKIPYTGATANVNLGSNNQIKAKEFDAIGTYVDKPNANRNYEFLKLNGAAIGVYQPQVWNGSAWVNSLSNGFGHLALQYNTGAYSSGFGYLALRNNTGSSSNGFGYLALQYNTGAYSSGFGYLALQNNTGSSSNGFGYNTLRYNTGANNSVLGYNSFANFYADTVNAKLFDATAIDIVAKTITIPNHAFGANGTYTNLRFVQGDSAVVGLSNGTIVQVKIIDANTIAFEEVIQAGQVRRNVNITNAGTGTGHKFEPQKSLSNINILGANINPTKSNQTIFAGGEAILPQATVATIDADGTNKALITKEWYNSKTSASLSNYYTKSEAVDMFVGLNGVQTIGGTKTFSESPIVPTPTLNTHAVNKGYVDTELNKKSEKNTNEEWYSTKRLTHPTPFMFKLAGSKSWVMHKPAFNYLIFAPSTTVNNEDWDWTKQIALRDDGRMKCNGYEVAGYDDNYVPTAGGNQAHKKDLLWTKKETYPADGSTTYLEPKGAMTIINISGDNDVTTKFILPRSAVNGQKIKFVNESDANWVEALNFDSSVGAKIYTTEDLEFTFMREADGEGVLVGNGFWYAYSMIDNKKKL